MRARVGRADQTPDAPSSSAADLLQALEDLRDEVALSRFALASPDAGQGRDLATSVRGQLDDYLLPRLRRLDAPLLAVVGGSTGAGKSTLVNSLLGRQVSPSGVLRPTTRQPVLAHAPGDRAWFTDGGLLPDLPRTTGAPSPDGLGLRLVEDASLPAGLALLDAPDIDSVVDANRELARQLLAAADLWLFVTTAARYADAVPWVLLQEAIDRGTAVAVVLDRVPPPAMAEVRVDLAQMLSAQGMRNAPLFTLTETQLSDERLPEAQLAPLRRWLAALSADARSRDVVVRKTLSGALASLQLRVAHLAQAADAQDEEEDALRGEAVDAYGTALGELAEHLSDGTLLRGEVLARWHELVGTGEIFASVQAGVGRLRDRVVAALSGRRAPAEGLEDALVTGVAALILDAAGTARERSLRAWALRPAGAQLLLANADTPAADPRVPASMITDVERLVRRWQGHVLDLVRAEGGDRRSKALAMSLGVSGAGAVLMLVVFAASAGLTGAEAGIAAGTAALAQRVLQAAFGDQAVRTLARAARDDLMTRAGALLARERAALEDLLAVAGEPGAGERLRRCADAVDSALGAVPADPEDPADSADPEDPADSADPAESTGGEVPDDGAQPDEAAQTDEPAQPEEPGQPAPVDRPGSLPGPLPDAQVSA